MEKLSGLKEYLDTPRRIFITTHRKPDGDAMGSMLAMYHYLLKKGHEVIPVSPTDFGLYLHWMPGCPSVLNFQVDQEKVLAYLQNTELIICLDFNALSRIDRLGEHIRVSNAPKLMIDHHLEPEAFDNWRLWNPEASATAELVYEYMSKMGDLMYLDRIIADCIYTGIMTDTGSFRYASVSSRVHEIVAHLLLAGADHTMIHQKIYDNFSENRLRFFGHCLKEKLVVLSDFRAAYISISKEEMDAYDIQTGDTEGLVNFPMNMNDVIFTALIAERENIVKLSLRSKGNFPANEFSTKYFSGGGHLNAAGGSYKGSLEQTINILLEGLKNYKPLLLSS